MSSLQTYLAKHYGSGSKKKKKSSSSKKQRDLTAAVAIIDSEDESHPAPHSEDDETPDTSRPSFTAQSWTTLDEKSSLPLNPSVSEDKERPPPEWSDDEPSDTELVRKRRRSPSASPEPQSTLDGQGVDQGPRMSDGTRAGLQTADAIKRDLAAKRQQEMERLSKLDPAISGKNAQTVYRDMSGRKVDIAAQRAEALALERQKEAEEEARMEWGKGLKQNRDAQALAERLAKEEAAPLAVYADDKERNRELKEKDRWGDPMARLLAKKKEEKGEVKQVYRGPPPPPNRFGIPPVCLF